MEVSNSPSSPYLSSGQAFLRYSLKGWLSSKSFVSGVMKKPGQRAFTVILYLAHSAAKALLKLITPPFAA